MLKKEVKITKLDYMLDNFIILNIENWDLSLFLVPPCFGPIECNDNGYCIFGTCYCYKGYKGADCMTDCECSLTYATDTNCLSDGTCSCKPGFFGEKCDERCADGYYGFPNCQGKYTYK